MIKPSALLLYPLFAPIFLLNEAVKAENLSIGNGNFQSMRPCAQSCLGDPSGDDVRTGIGCGTVNGLGQNECYCREDLQPAASSWLSTCVMARCSSNTVDLTSVISLYDNYCATALAAEATTSGSAATTTGGTTTSSGGIPKQTSSSASSSTFGPSLSTTIRTTLSTPTETAPAGLGSTSTSATSPIPTTAPLPTSGAILSCFQSYLGFGMGLLSSMVIYLML